MIIILSVYVICSYVCFMLMSKVENVDINIFLFSIMVLLTSLGWYIIEDLLDDIGDRPISFIKTKIVTLLFLALTFILLLQPEIVGAPNLHPATPEILSIFAWVFGLITSTIVFVFLFIVYLLFLVIIKIYFKSKGMPTIKEGLEMWKQKKAK